MDRMILALAAWGGGVIIALIGFFDSKEKFDIRKFGASVLRSFVAGVGFAGLYNPAAPLSINDFILAFVSGAGFDKSINSIGSILGNAQFPFPSKSPAPAPSSPSGPAPTPPG